MDHDLDLVEIDKVIRNCVDVRKVITESELQSCDEYEKDRRLVPFVRLRSDRVLFVDSRLGPDYVALEYERTVKVKSRIESKLQSYYQRKNIQALFYVCKSQSVMNALAKVEVEISKVRKSKVYFCLISSIMSSSGKITFENVNGNKVNFKLNY